MISKRNVRPLLIPVLTSLLILAGTMCAPTISRFNQHAYVQATSLKVDALMLMEKGTEDFEKHREEVTQLRSDLQKMVEFERNRLHNEVSLQMWELLTNPEENLLGGFLKRWEEKGPVSAYYIQEKKKQVGFAFDQIAQLESKKIKPENVSTP